MAPKEIRFEDMDWIQLDKDTVEHLALSNTTRNILVQ
jgi:hypothetical protein